MKNQDFKRKIARSLPLLFRGETQRHGDGFVSLHETLLTEYSKAQNRPLSYNCCYLRRCIIDT